MTSLWRNDSVNVVANSNWSCSLFSVPAVHWRVQPTAARWSDGFNKMRGALRALHVSLNNASTRTLCKCSKRNNGHLITLRIWMLWRYPVCGATNKAIFKPSEAQRTVSALKVALEKIWNIFPQVQLIKLSRFLQAVWQEYVNGEEIHSKHLSLLKKEFALKAFAFAPSWIVEAIFDNVSTAKLPLKAA